MGAPTTSREHSLFRTLIEGFCRSCKLADPQAVMAGESLDVDGVTFILLHKPELNPHLLFIYSDFGEVPAGAEADVYRATLEANLKHYGGEGPTFGVDSATGHVIMAETGPLISLTPALLASFLKAAAAEAKRWRSQIFRLADAGVTEPA
jgi:hypothetical protein